MTAREQTTQQHLQQMFLQGGGYITTGELKTQGLYFHLLGRWVQQGKAQQVQRGVYRLMAAPLLQYEELLEVQLRFPMVRYCLITALNLHGLTTTQPSYLQVAIPQHRTLASIFHPPLEVHYYSKAHYSRDVMAFPLADTTRSLQLYSPEKTLTDMLYYHQDREIYLEGLKNYLRQNKTPHKLIQAALIPRVKKQLLSDLEVLLHDTHT